MAVLEKFTLIIPTIRDLPILIPSMSYSNIIQIIGKAIPKQSVDLHEPIQQVIPTHGSFLLAFVCFLYFCFFSIPFFFLLPCCATLSSASFFPGSFLLLSFPLYCFPSSFSSLSLVSFALTVHGRISFHYFLSFFFHPLLHATYRFQQ
ncbi:unnamed protein product [Cuscuta epithymum]|uniref:Uncharacterized protein n=1 Tax=Cuscuta epithymum TaxID=186058 RepID=A0AAV0DD63_9ASTE|nr:unnamed protein product [Cuscuta epithymum]